MKTRHHIPRSNLSALPVGANVGLAVAMDPMNLELIYQVGDVHIGLSPDKAAIFVAKQIEMLEQLKIIGQRQAATTQ
jgi:hypothetical protein